MQDVRPTTIAAPERMVRGGEDGLEVRWWLTRSTDASLRLALDRFGQTPVGVPPDLLDLLRRNDMELLSVRLDDLDALQGRLRLIGGLDRQWFGQARFWTIIGRGLESETTFRVALDTGRVTLPAGRLVLLMRCWTLPAPSASGDAVEAGLRIELIPQHRERRRDDSIDLLSIDEAPETEDAKGLVFERFLLGVTPRPGDALVLVPVPPRAGEPDEPGPSGASEPAGAGPVAGAPPSTPGLGEVARGPGADAGAGANAGVRDAREVRDAMQPENPQRRVRTLGEALMANLGQDGAPTTRAVLVLIPRVPPEFRLIRDGVR